MNRLFVFLAAFYFVSTISIAGTNGIPGYDGNIEQWGKNTLSYVSNWRNFTDQTREDNKKLIIMLDQLISKYPDNSRLYIIQGQLYGKEAGYVVAELKKSGVTTPDKMREEIKNNSEYLQAIKSLNENYKKALELDNGALTLNELSIINGTITKADIKVENLRHMINLWNQGKRFEVPEGVEVDPVTHFEYDAYARIVTAYLDEKRYDEALSVINEIEEKFPTMQSEIDLGRQRIAGFIQKENSAEQEKPSQPTESKKSDVKQPRLVVGTAQKPATKSDEHRIDTTPKEEVDYTRYLLVLVLLAVGVVVLVYLLRRRGKKQTP